MNLQIYRDVAHIPNMICECLRNVDLPQARNTKCKHSIA